MCEVSGSNSKKKRDLESFRGIKRGFHRFVLHYLVLEWN